MNDNTSKNDAETQETLLRPEKFAFFNAKCILQQSNNCDRNIYDHIALIIRNLLKGNQEDSHIELEKLSNKLKQYYCPAVLQLLHDVPSPSSEMLVANLQNQFFPSGARMKKLNKIPNLPDLPKLFFVLRQAGLGFSQEEAVKLTFSIRSLLVSEPITSLRFWGKIYGTQANYFVLEVERSDIQKQYNASVEMKIKSDEIKNIDEEKNKSLTLELEALEMDQLPKPDWKQPPEIPPEEYGKGTNRKTYYVCNTLGEKWTCLPNVTPEQISASQKIKYLCTGNLEAEILTYPTFPGVEKNFLRAQIARITGSTIISPLNFYQFSEDEEEEAIEEDSLRETFVENPDYETMTIYDLADQGLGNWVHHTAYILPQGRTVWWNPASKSKGNVDEISEDEDDEENEEEPDEPEPETGPPLLTPLSEDAEINGLPAWSTRITSHLIPHYAYAVLSSNNWPGAHAIASGKFFENIYVGWGVKYTGTNFSPVAIPKPLEEFPSGLDITEVEDPTPEEEAAWKAAQAELARRQAQNQEEEEEEEEEAEENSDDADD